MVPKLGLSLLAVLLLACLACTAYQRPAPAAGGEATPPRSAAARPSGCAAASAAPLLPGKLLETGTTTIDLWDHGRRTPIVCSPGSTSYLGYPTFAPDGRELAYVLSTVPTGQGQDWGDDIYTANVDGSNARLLLRHDAPGVHVDSLTWAPDGSALIFGYFRAVYDSRGQFTSAIYQVRGIPLAGGSPTTLVDKASQASVSWDGKQIVYVSYPSPDYTVSALGIANVDGSGAHAILGNLAGFQSYLAPHLSPDGRQLVFAAVGGPVGGAPAPKAANGLGGLLRRLGARLAAPHARADGSPYEVWVVNLDGSGLHPVANLREDLPFPLWSASGKQILFLGAGALYLASADGSEVKQIDKGVAHAQIDWYQH
jgi:Tol biopolymer transport system component